MASSKATWRWRDGANEARRIEATEDTEEERFLVELMVVRTRQCFKGCFGIDGSRENWIVAAICTAAPAFRVAYFLTGVYLIIQSRFFLDRALVFRYDNFASGSGESPGIITMNVCLVLWAIDFLFLAAAYHYAQLASIDRWVRSSPSIGYCIVQWVAGLLYGAFFVSAAVVGIISTHTILSHMWHARNGWFAGLLGVQCVMLVVGALGDAIDLCSSWGVQKASRIASVLLALRLRVLVPVTVIFSVTAILASWPPS
mgnify:CR=1 FL=1